MSLAGKRDEFSIDDLIEIAGVGDVKKARAKSILSEVSNAVADWETFAREADIPDSDIDRIMKTHRRELFV